MADSSNPQPEYKQYSIRESTRFDEERSGFSSSVARLDEILFGVVTRVSLNPSAGHQTHNPDIYAIATNPINDDGFVVYYSFNAERELIIFESIIQALP